MTIKFDKDMPHGTVHGECINGVVYYQDGNYFNALGVHVDPHTGQPIKYVPSKGKKGAALTNKEAAMAAEIEALKKRLAAAEAPTPDPEAPEEDEDGVEDGEIDLDAYAAGKLKGVLFGEIRKAVKAKFGIDVVSKKEAIEAITGK